MTDFDVYLLIAIVGMTATTVVTRSAFLLIPQRWQLPPNVQAALRYAPIAAIAAIVAPDIFIAHHAAHGFSVQGALNPKLWGAIAGTLVFMRWRSMGATIGVGMAVYWALRYWV